MLQLAAERIFSRPVSHAVFCVWYVYETYKNANGLNSFLFQSTESQAVPAVSQGEVRSFVKPDVAGRKPGHSMFTGSWERALSRLLLSINSKWTSSLWPAHCWQKLTSLWWFFEKGIKKGKNPSTQLTLCAFVFLLQTRNREVVVRTKQCLGVTRIFSIQTWVMFGGQRLKWNAIFL